MGGKVLELYTEERYREGKEEGRQEGREEGRQEGKAEGTLKTLADLVTDGILTIGQAAQRAGMSVLEFQRRAERITKP